MKRLMVEFPFNFLRNTTWGWVNDNYNTVNKVY